MDLPVIIALVALVAGIIGILDAVVGRQRLLAQIDSARTSRPVDEATGLYNQRAFTHRVTSDLKRAQRTDGAVWLSVWTVVEGEPDRFGRVAADGLRFPEIGFRLDERVFCFERPEMTEAERSDMLLRLRAAAPRERVAVGEVTWRGGDTDAMRLLHAAIEVMR